MRCVVFVFVWGWRLYAMDLNDAEIMGSFMHLVIGVVLFLPARAMDDALATFVEIEPELDAAGVS